MNELETPFQKLSNIYFNLGQNVKPQALNSRPNSDISPNLVTLSLVNIYFSTSFAFDSLFF